MDRANRASAVGGESGYRALSGDGGVDSGGYRAFGGSDMEFTRGRHSRAETLSFSAWSGDGGLAGCQVGIAWYRVWPVFDRGIVYGDGRSAVGRPEKPGISGSVA